MTWAMKEKRYSQRRACRLVGIDPCVFCHRSTRPDDEGVRVRLRELAGERRRFGYRRLHILLAREGVEMNGKKLQRLYREEGLTVRKRGGRKRAIGTRAPMPIPQGRNQRWSLDFVSDALACGRRFRILCVIDDFTREALTTVVDVSLSAERVARELDRIAGTRGYPGMVVSDNGTELTSNAILRWQEDRRIEWRYMAPGKSGASAIGMAVNPSGAQPAVESRQPPSLRTSRSTTATQIACWRRSTERAETSSSSPSTACATKPSSVRSPPLVSRPSRVAGAWDVRLTFLADE